MNRLVPRNAETAMWCLAGSVQRIARAVFNDDARLQAANEMVTEVQSKAAKTSVNERPVIVTSKALPHLVLELPGSENKNVESAPPQNRKDLTLNSPALDAIQCAGSNACYKIRAYFADRYKDGTLREFRGIVRDRALFLAPYAMFLFLPVFAALTYLLYRKRSMFYGEHVVYALHVHAFAYFLLMVEAFAAEWLAGLLWLWGVIYFGIAMRRVFGGRWWATLLRYIL